ncbi:MAG: hypothetical protein NTV19_20660 [Burkholderiales bacterium]|nr:hypothetical protein [Burkholderiales bacterium]
MTPASAANPDNLPPVLRVALMRHLPLYRKAVFFSLISSLLVLAPTLFMLEVYERVINSRSNTTLVMLLILVIGAYVVMELLEMVRGEIMAQAGLALDQELRTRLFDLAFEGNLRRGGGSGNTQVFTDLKTVREFLSSPALMAMMDVPSSILFLVLVFIIPGWG